MKPLRHLAQPVIPFYMRLTKWKTKTQRWSWDFFDISQRAKIPANIMSLTMPYFKFAELEEDCDKSCTTSHAGIDLKEKRGMA